MNRKELAGQDLGRELRCHMVLWTSSVRPNLVGQRRFPVGLESWMKAEWEQPSKACEEHVQWSNGKRQLSMGCKTGNVIVIITVLCSVGCFIIFTNLVKLTSFLFCAKAEAQKHGVI